MPTGWRKLKLVKAAACRNTRGNADHVLRPAAFVACVDSPEALLGDAVTRLELLRGLKQEL